MDESANEQSDWDLYLFCEKEYSGGFYEWNGALLDITFRKWPQEGHDALTNAYAPLFPVKVLFDESDGALDHLLTQTETAHVLGPMKGYAKGCSMRMQKLLRKYEKMEKYTADPDVQFFYLGEFHALAVRLWFERQNIWPLPPKTAFASIRKDSPEFAVLLHELSVSSALDRLRIAKQILERIKNLTYVS